MTFCQAIKQIQFDAIGFAIDTWLGDEHTGFYANVGFEHLEAEVWSTYQGIAILLRSTFDDAREDFQNNTVDLLQIDGRHRYEDVKHDFETWISAVSSRGVVLFHDTRVQRKRTLIPTFQLQF